MTASPDISRRMKALRKTLEKRIAMADRADELAARERAARPIRSGSLAVFDTAALGRRLRPMLEYDGRGWRVIAEQIGVTSPDLSRVMAGQDISAAKVFAICDWAGLDPRRFYRPAAHAPKPRKRARKGFASRAAGAPAGRATTPDARSGLRPAADDTFHVASTETVFPEQETRP